MRNRRPTWTGLLALSVLVTASCAHGRADLVMGAPGLDSDAICTVRVTSGYREPVEAGVRARSEGLELGTLDPDDDVEIGVPCAYRAVTVFRIVRNGSDAPDAWIGPLSRALDPRGVTTFILRPPSVRGPSLPRR